MPRRQQRLRPTEDQVTELQDLFRQVPVEPRFDWGSDAGQAFLTRTRRVVDSGVPVSWLAQELGLTANALYVLLSRYRREGAA